MQVILLGTGYPRPDPERAGPSTAVVVGDRVFLVDAGRNVMTRYCHMVQPPFVQEGQQVRAGERIGRVGTSGNSSGPHLHYEIVVKGQPVNPRAYLWD